MTSVCDLTGHRFGTLFAVCRYGSTPTGQATWWCYCDCGTEFVAVGTHLVGGVRSCCGCVSRARIAAKRAGRKRYFTGLPCPHGHIAERLVSNGSCSVCERLSSQRRFAEDPDRIRQQNKARRAANVEKRRTQDRIRRALNPEKRCAATRAWRAANPDYLRTRRRTDIQFYLAELLRVRLYQAIRRGAKAGSAVRDLGCTIPELKIWIESQFQPGMSWGNRRLWHIDHKRPLASFDLTDREQFLAACHWKNLQPLWALDNLSKGVRYGSH